MSLISGAFLLNRRRFCRDLSALCVGAGLIFPRFSSADDAISENANDLPATKYRREIAESLEALAARQNDDGSFGSSSELFGRDPGVAALCGLAFLASGSAPRRGRFGARLELILNFLRESQFDAERTTEPTKRAFFDEYRQKGYEVDGLIVNPAEKGAKPTYGHGYATLFLAESLALASDATVRKSVFEALEKAVGLIVCTQNGEGGWRYEPMRAVVADLSVTTCQLCALRAARNVGVYVPEDDVKRGVEYLVGLQNADGGFRYVRSEGPSGYGRTAAAIHALQACDYQESTLYENAFRYLESIYPTEGVAPVKKERIEYWNYAQFYASLAYWRAAVDEQTQARWRNFAKRSADDLLDRRGKDGLWRSNVSTEVETAFAICALLAPCERTASFLK